MGESHKCPTKEEYSKITKENIIKRKRCRTCGKLLGKSLNHSCEHPRGMLGKSHSENSKVKIRKTLIKIGHHPPKDKRARGRTHGNWKGGVTPITFKIRNSLKYKEWRLKIFERDKYTCVCCGKIGGMLNADHIKPFSLFPELRFKLSNGRTLCVPCHKKTDTYGGKVRCIIK